MPYHIASPLLRSCVKHSEHFSLSRGGTYINPHRDFTFRKPFWGAKTTPIPSFLFLTIFFSHSSFSFFISLVFLSFAPLSCPHVKQGRERPRENHRRRDDTRHTLVHRRQSHRARHPPAPPGIPLLLTHSLTHSLPLAPSLARIATTATYPAFTR